MLSKPVAGKRSQGSGKVIVISSPSGGGKTTICRMLLAQNKTWQFSISYTTRDMREGETNGKEYYFVDRSRFEHLRQAGFFAESARVHLHYYGTPRKPLEQSLKKGKVIILDVDVKGAFSIKRKYPHALTIFILPPSRRELQRRLKKRGTETRAQLALRLKNAIAEMNMYKRFDYVIINKDLKKAVTAADYLIKSWTIGVTYFGRNKSAYNAVIGKT